MNDCSSCGALFRAFPPCEMSLSLDKHEGSLDEPEGKLTEPRAQAHTGRSAHPGSVAGPRGQPACLCPGPRCRLSSRRLTRGAALPAALLTSDAARPPAAGGTHLRALTLGAGVGGGSEGQQAAPAVCQEHRNMSSLV